MHWLLLLPLGYLLLVVGVAWVSLRPPRIPLFLSPGSLGAPQETVRFTADDGTPLIGWWTETPGATATVVFAHGYAMNRAELASAAYLAHRRGYHTLLFDFRRHGGSGGRISTIGWQERRDVRAAVEWVRSRHPEGRVALVGSSMGSAAIAFAAAEWPGLADALVLDSAYGRLSSATVGWWRFLLGRWGFLLWPTVLFAGPMAGLNPWKVDVAEALKRVKVPVLFLHGDRDTLALPEEARRNHTSVPDAPFVWFAGCGHSEGRWEQPARYEEALFGFLSAECGVRSAEER